MKSRTRYGLIIFGFIVFLILAPILVLYISGRKVDLNNRDTDQTGILDAKSNPGGATVTLDGKNESTTPAIVRFLNQGEYLVNIHKDGFYDWKKRLPIEQSKVTYAQVGVDEVQLIKQSTPVTLVPEGVTNFVLLNDELWYATQNSIVRTSLSPSAKKVIIPTPDPKKSITLSVLRDKKHIYLGNGYILNTNDNSIVQDPEIYSLFDSADNVAVTPNGIVISANGSALKAFDPSTKIVTSLGPKMVGAVTMIDNTGYFLEVEYKESKITSAVWNGTQFVDFQTLATYKYGDLSGSFNSLYITNSKKLFCNCGGTLYRVNSELEKLDGVLSARLDLTTDELVYQNASELSFYNFLINKPQLLTRGIVDPTSYFMIRSNIGYGFIGNNSGLEAVEIDNRDQQNRYQLLSGKKVWQIAITTNEKAILALQDGALLMLEIRN
jgi:hypothetical protein